MRVASVQEAESQLYISLPVLGRCPAESLPVRAFLCAKTEVEQTTGTAGKKVLLDLLSGPHLSHIF
jgi:hypothetical protein